METDVQVKDTIGYHRLASLQAFNMTIPGIPVIFYGDEFGMPGAGDPDNRRMMKFDSLNKHEEALRSITSKLAKLRAGNLALIYGDYKTLKVNDKIFIYMRSYFERSVIVIFNKDRSQRQIDVEIPTRFANAAYTAHFGNTISIKNGKMSLQLQANSFEIVTN